MRRSAVGSWRAAKLCGVALTIQCIVTAADRMLCAIRQNDSGGGITGNVGGQDELSAFTFPRHIYGSILRFKATLGPRQAFVWLRMNHKPPIACILLVYAADGAENPIVYSAVGIMIEALFFRRSIGLIHLPAFPNCSGTALYLCQPRRRLCLVQKRIGEFCFVSLTAGSQSAAV